MFQVVDTQRGRLSESDGAKMPGDFEPVGVSVVDGRLQLGRREVVVSCMP